MSSNDLAQDLRDASVPSIFAINSSTCTEEVRRGEAYSLQCKTVKAYLGRLASPMLGHLDREWNRRQPESEEELPLSFKKPDKYFLKTT